MPDSCPCPAGSSAAAVTGSAPPPERGACPWPATAGRTALPLSVWPGVPGPGCPAPGPDYLPCPGVGAVPVIAAFARPGDLVAVPGAGCAALAAAAARTGRRILDIADPGGASCPPGQAALAVTHPVCVARVSPGSGCRAGVWPGVRRAGIPRISPVAGARPVAPP